MNKTELNKKKDTTKLVVISGVSLVVVGGVFMMWGFLAAVISYIGITIMLKKVITPLICSVLQ